MPTGAPFAKRGLPSRLPRILRSFPEHEIARLFFFVLIGIDARSRSNLQFPSVQSGKAAIAWKSRNAVVDGITFAIRVTALNQATDEFDHLRNVFGRGCNDLRLLDS